METNHNQSAAQARRAAPLRRKQSTSIVYSRQVLGNPKVPLPRLAAG